MSPNSLFSLGIKTWVIIFSGLGAAGLIYPDTENNEVDPQNNAAS